MNLVGRVLFVPLIVAGLCSCADSKVKGRVDDETFGKVLSAFYIEESGNYNELKLVVANYPEACLNYSSYFHLGAEPSEPPPLKVVGIQFFVSGEIGEGTWDIVAPSETYEDQIQWVHGGFDWWDGNAWQGYDAQSGSVTLTARTESEIEGEFEMTLDNGDELSGRFRLDPCPDTEI